MIEFIISNQELILNVIIIVASILCPSPLTKVISALKNAKEVKKEVDEIRGKNGQKGDK